MADNEQSPEAPPREPIPMVLRLAMLGTMILIVLLVAIRWLNGANVFPNWLASGENAYEIAAQRDDVREVRITTPDGLELYAWVQGPDDAPRKFIQFGGNGESVGPNAGLYDDSVKALDAQFLVFDYRGYGHSPGRPSEAGLYEDSRGVYRYAVDELGWKPGEVIFWGRSLGCAPAIKLASELQREERAEALAQGAPPRALILEAPFLSIPKMASERMGFLGRPDWLVYFLFDNESRAGALESPVFLFHGESDKVVPFEHGRQLFDQLDAPKELMALECGHNDIWVDNVRGAEIRKRIDAFLGRHS